MASLQYRPDWEQARERLTTWWNGGDIGRPAMLVGAPRAEPIENIPQMPEPEGWPTHYSTTDFEYRVNLALRSCINTEYFGEAMPGYSSGDLAPNCLALYLGCQGVEREEGDTVWCEPFINDPETDGFGFDPDNFYWKFTIDATKRVQSQAAGKFLEMFPDLIEGLDTLAAMRGTQTLLTDLIERPHWVHASLRKITDLYFRYYDVLYDLIRDQVGGSAFWVWAPGRIAKFQCDFSAMISPAMFREFMVPVLTEMTERVSYSLYHWDGPGAIPHHDALLSIPRLNMIQWTPGSSNEDSWHPRWWPLHHKTLDAGKKLFIGADTEDQLLALKREFGEQCKQMLIGSPANTADEARRKLEVMEF